MKSRPHFFLNGLRPDRSEGRAVRKEGENSFMSVEDEFEETRRALHRMLKDAFEGKLVLQGDGDRSYFSVVDLPLDADRDTLKYTYTNGVLDVVIARKRSYN